MRLPYEVSVDARNGQNTTKYKDTKKNDTDCMFKERDKSALSGIFGGPKK